jgi:hypothetical protein
MAAQHAATASIKKPIHNVKERRQIRQSTALAAEAVVFISGKIIMVELNGFEPLTPCLQSRCSTS